MTEDFKYPEPDRSTWGRFRDNLAYAIATFVFNKIATRWYSAMIEGSIRLGLEAARHEAHNERAMKTEDMRDIWSGRVAAPEVSDHWPSGRDQ